MPAASEKWLRLIDHYFGYLLEAETGRFGITTKNVLDFIEDFINHKFWALRRQYKDYFPNDNSFLRVCHYSFTWTTLNKT